MPELLEVLGPPRESPNPHPRPQKLHLSPLLRAAPGGVLPPLLPLRLNGSQRRHPPPPVPEPEPDPESEPEAGDKAEEEGGDDGQDEAQENNVDDDGNASDRSVVFLQDERRKAVPETSSKTPSRSTSRRKSAGPGLSLPPALPPPPKEFSIKITSQIDYLRNPTYTKAVKDRCEPFRPAGETAIYSVEVERDCFGPEGSDPDQLDDLMLGNSFKVTVKGILEEMLRLMKVDMPLCGVNYAISVHSTLLSVGWLNSRDNQLLEKQIRAPMPEVEPFGVIPAKEAIQALLRHYSNNPLTSGWYAKLTLNLILGPDPSPPAPEPLSTAQTNAAQSQQPAHIAYMAQNHPGVVMPTTTPGRNRNSTTTTSSLSNFLECRRITSWLATTDLLFVCGWIWCGDLLSPAGCPRRPTGTPTCSDIHPVRSCSVRSSVCGGRDDGQDRAQAPRCLWLTGTRSLWREILAGISAGTC